MHVKISRGGDRKIAFGDIFGINLRPDPVERAGQVGRLGGLAVALLRSSHPLVPLLRQAERDDAALAQALATIAVLPPPTRRRLIATFAATEFTKLRREPLERGKR